tara:strand:+ start:17661 stop:17915 length:255 start_codon:yes stop_codon:yes gene_type:complete
MEADVNDASDGTAGTISQRILRRVRMLLALTVLVCVTVIVLQNSESVDTRLLFVTVTMPQAALLFGAMLVGFVFGLFSTLWFRR